MDIQTKRVYDPGAPDDGARVLVDRVWPRGISKERAHADVWLKEIAPSTDLRKWFGHDPKKWTAFKKRYFSELESNEGSKELLDWARRGRLTLLYSARDTEHNQAVALKEYILKQDSKK